MVDASRVFDENALGGLVAIITGGGTNFGKAAALELVRRARARERSIG